MVPAGKGASTVSVLQRALAATPSVPVPARHGHDGSSGIRPGGQVAQHVFPAFRLNDVKKIPVAVQPAAEAVGPWRCAPYY